VKPLDWMVVLGSVVAVGIAGACSGSGSGPHVVEPDAMLPNPEDVMGSEDATDATLGYFTWMRIGQLLPALGPVSVCVLPPGSSTWSPLLPPSTITDAGAEAEAASDGPSPDARPDVGPADAPSPSDAVSHEGGPSEGGMKADGALVDAPVDGPVDGPADVRHADVDAGTLASAHLQPLTMSRYIRLDGAGTFQLAILPAGASSCAGAYFTQAVTLDSDKHTTVVLAQTRAGALAPAPSYLDAGAEAAALPFGLLTYTDEPGTVLSSARTRFINAAIPTTTDAGSVPLSAAVLDSTANLVPLARAIEPDRGTDPSQTPPVVDALGYHDGEVVLGMLALRIGPTGDGGALPWTSAAEDLGLGAGSSHTAFILSAATGGEFRVLWCNDLSQESVLTDCLVIGQ